MNRATSLVSLLPVGPGVARAWRKRGEPPRDHLLSAAMGRRATSSARCIHCRMLEHLCVCALVPDLDLETRVMIVMHRREWSKSTATAPLARLALRNCEIRLRGQRDDPGSQRGERLVSCDIPTEQRQTLLLFPTPGAVMLTRELVAADPRPVMLVVPDGSWRQAAKITQREPVLAGLPRVVLPDTGADVRGVVVCDGTVTWLSSEQPSRAGSA